MPKPNRNGCKNGKQTNLLVQGISILVFYLALYFRHSEKTGDATVSSLLPLATSTATLQTKKSISTCSNL